MQKASNRSGVPAADRKAPQQDQQGQGLENQNLTRPAPVDQPSENPKRSRTGLEDRNITQANPPTRSEDGE